MRKFKVTEHTIGEHVEITIRRRRPDFSVENHGSVVGFRPISRAAKERLREVDAEPWQMFGGALVLDHRPAVGFAATLEFEGFRLR